MESKAGNAGPAGAVEGQVGAHGQPSSYTQPTGSVKVESDIGMQGPIKDEAGAPAAAEPGAQMAGNSGEADREAAHEEASLKPRVTIEEVASVQHMIEKCMLAYLSQNEVVQVLWVSTLHLLS